MTDAAPMPTRADAQFVHDGWDRRTRAHDIEGLQAPEREQVDLVEVMELAGPRIAYHRIYWGWYGTPLLQPHR
jgi:hypothetical protein